MLHQLDMPVNDGVGDVLNSLKNSFNLRIHIFTNRPWPIYLSTDSNDFISENKKSWLEQEKLFSTRTYSDNNCSQKIKRLFRSVTKFFPYRIKSVKMLLKKTTELEKITQIWLDKNGISYNKLVVEFGNEEVSAPNAHIYNRFYAARKMPIKYFVEDDLRKAKKLSYICDFVFLINHPYNQDDNLPSNVIRVDSWREILQQMRDFA
jgi:uncharacterized HAD superfamily protein